MKKKLITSTPVPANADGIQVTVIDSDRLAAITHLSKAILAVAEALNAEPQIAITGNTINNASKSGIEINTGE